MMAYCKCGKELKSFKDVWFHKANKHPKEQMTVLTEEEYFSYPPKPGRTISHEYHDDEIHIGMNWRKKDMVDIGIYTKDETLEEKIKHAEESNSVWWDINYSKKLMDLGIDRVFFATDSTWQGYFKVPGWAIVAGKLRIFLGDYTPLEPRPKENLPAFQGYTYDVPEVEDE